MLSSRSLQIPPGDDASSSAFAHARTPARALLKHRSGALRENAIYHGSMTVKAKGKSGFATPFNHARKAPQTAIRVKTLATPSVFVSRPLGDKTPFPNRQPPPVQQLRTPKPQAGKLLLEAENADLQMLPSTPECLLLPSATRRRRSLRLPSAISKSLKTPATKGDHWDVSDGDVDLGAEEEDGDVELGADGAQSKTAGVKTGTAEADDDDEIEYMPPKMPERPWTPTFDMPDYKSLGRALLRVAHGEHIDDSMDVFYSQDIEKQLDVPALLVDSGAFQFVNLPLLDLEDDDPFSVVLTSRPSSQLSGPRDTSVASSTPTNSRPGTALSRPASQSSMHSRTVSLPTLNSTAPHMRGGTIRNVGAATTTASRSTLTSQTQGSQRTAATRPGSQTRLSTNQPKSIATKAASAAAVTRRIQPPRMASSRPDGESLTRLPTRAANTATANGRLGTRGVTVGPIATGDKVLKGTKPIVSRFTASKSRSHAGGPSSSSAATRPASVNAELLDPGLQCVGPEIEAVDADYLFHV